MNGNCKDMGFFSNPMGHSPVEICSIVPQIKLHLDIVRMNVLKKFHFSTCNLCEKMNENSWWTARQTCSSKAIYCYVGELCGPWTPCYECDYILQTLKQHDIVQFFSGEILACQSYLC